MDGALVGSEGDSQTRTGSMGNIFELLAYYSICFVGASFHKHTSQKRSKKGDRRQRPGELKSYGDILRKRNKINFMKSRKRNKSKEK